MKENKNLEDKKKKFILDLKLLEIESVKYMIKNYLRVRLIKVLKYIIHIMHIFLLMLF